MKIKVSDATPRQLNWMVATVEFDKPAIHSGVVHAAEHYMPFSPATDWSHAGPIIEREDIALWPDDEEGGWFASSDGGRGEDYKGPTPLIAAMRCYVASRLGDEVEIPDELV